MRCWWERWRAAAWLAALTVCGSATTFAQGPPTGFRCVASATTPSIRAEGLTELVGDVVLRCSGGAPTAAGASIPTYDVKLSLNLPLSNTPLGSLTVNGSFAPLSAATNALLSVDEPPIPRFAPQCSKLEASALEACRAGLLWPALGDGDGVAYGENGTANIGFGTRSGITTLLWLGVPIDARAAEQARVLRISNVRADASAVPVGGGADPSEPFQIRTFVSVCPSAGGACPLEPTSLTLGTVDSLPPAATVEQPTSRPHCQSQTVQDGVDFRLRFREVHPTDFRIRARQTPGPLDGPRTTESGVWSDDPTLGQALPRAPFGMRFGATFSNVPANAKLYISTINLPATAGEAPRGALTLDPLGPFDPPTPEFSQTVNGVTVPFIRLTGPNPSATFEVVGANADAIEDLVFVGGFEYQSGGTIATSPPEGTITVDLSTGVAPGCSVGADPPALSGATAQDVERFRAAGCAYAYSYGLSADGPYQGYLRRPVQASSLPPNRFAVGTIHGCSGAGPQNSFLGLPNDTELVFNVQQDGNVPPYVQWIEHSPLAPATDITLSVTAETLAQLSPETPAVTANWLTAESNGRSTPITTSLAVDPSRLTPGTYLGRVTAASPSGGDLRLSVRLNLTPPGPYFDRAGLVHAASYLRGAVAPGEAIVVFGSNFGPEALAGLELGSDGMVSTRIGETRVLFDGQPAPMIYAARGQVSAFAPFSLAGKIKTVVEVEYQDKKSRAVTVAVLPAAPVIFTQNQTGGGPGAILNQDSSVNSSERPAHAGDIVQIFGSGGGQTNPGGVDGRLAGASLAQFLEPVAALVDGRTAEVVYAGPAPGLAEGVFQVNIRVPPETEPGATAEVLLAFGSRTTQLGVTLAVE
ncbi:MAG: hypothetical protein GC160_25765 [Acidobacteria bacterium]|nr:hypothetical protein [Acidobacteriota bacterium]